MKYNYGGGGGGTGGSYETDGTTGISDSPAADVATGGAAGPASGGAAGPAPFPPVSDVASDDLDLDLNNPINTPHNFLHLCTFKTPIIYTFSLDFYEFYFLECIFYFYYKRLPKYSYNILLV